jgi:hypothetical protein
MGRRGDSLPCGFPLREPAHSNAAVPLDRLHLPQVHGRAGTVGFVSAPDPSRGHLGQSWPSLSLSLIQPRHPCCRERLLADVCCCNPSDCGARMGVGVVHARLWPSSDCRSRWLWLQGSWSWLQRSKGLECCPKPKYLELPRS